LELFNRFWMLDYSIEIISGWSSFDRSMKLALKIKLNRESSAIALRKDIQHSLTTKNSSRILKSVWYLIWLNVFMREFIGWRSSRWSGRAWKNSIDLSNYPRRYAIILISNRIPSSSGRNWYWFILAFRNCN
jgi:hypothetical protein